MQKTEVLIVQRYYYNFREGIFDRLESIGFPFKLFNSTKSRGRVKVHEDRVKSAAYIYPVYNFNITDSVVCFPFLFFSLIRHNPSVVVTEGGQNTLNNIAIYIYSKLFNKKYIIWDLGKGYKHFESTLFRRIYMFIYTFLARNAQLVFGYNSSSKKYFEELGVKSDKIVVLNNTVDTISLRRIISTRSEEIPLDMQCIIKQKKKVFIFVGSLLPSKNIESLAELLDLLGAEYHLLIVGAGQDEYTCHLKTLFANRNVTFVGYKRPEDLYPYYHVARFAILPGLGGLAINQAMAYGVPVLCTQADGAEVDIVHDNVTGYIYEDNTDAARYIQQMTDEGWKRMGASAAGVLYGDFSLESECDRFVNAVKSLM